MADAKVVFAVADNHGMHWDCSHQAVGIALVGRPNRSFVVEGALPCHPCYWHCWTVAEAGAEDSCGWRGSRWAGEAEGEGYCIDAWRTAGGSSAGAE